MGLCTHVCCVNGVDAQPRKRKPVLDVSRIQSLVLNLNPDNGGSITITPTEGCVLDNEDIRVVLLMATWHVLHRTPNRNEVEQRVYDALNEEK